MTEPRQRVVFRKVADMPTLASPGGRHECGRQIGRAALNHEATILDELRAGGAGLHFFHRDFGMRMNELAELDQGSSFPIDSINDPLLNLVHLFLLSVFLVLAIIPRSTTGRTAGKSGHSR